MIESIIALINMSSQNSITENYISLYDYPLFVNSSGKNESIVSELQSEGRHLVLEKEENKRSKVTNVRLPFGMIISIDEWIRTGLFKSKSDFVLSAVRHYLLYLSEKDIPPLCSEENEIE